MKDDLKRRLIAALLLSYPARWRREYGAELLELLQRSPMTVATIADVVWNGWRQRLRWIELPTWIGFAALIWMSALIGWNAAVLAPSHMTFPTVSILPFKHDYYVLFLMACGGLMHLRYGVTPARSGLATLKISFIAGIPIVVIGAWVGLGLMRVPVAGYAADTDVPGALAVMTAPIARLGESWIWGAVGAQLGGAVARWIRRLGEAGE